MAHSLRWLLLRRTPVNLRLPTVTSSAPRILQHFEMDKVQAEYAYEERTCRAAYQRHSWVEASVIETVWGHQNTSLAQWAKAQTSFPALS